MKRLALALAMLAAACAGPAQDARGVGRFASKLEFRGAASFDRKELLAAIESDLSGLERSSSPRSVIDDAAYSLEQFYISKGFTGVVVDYTLSMQGTQLESARFTLEEGPRTVLARVAFLGNIVFSRDELLALAGLPGFDRRTAPVNFVERDLRDATPGIADAYVARGFLDVGVAAPEIVLDAARTNAEVSIRIAEGTRYFLRAPPRIEGGIAQIDRELRVAQYVGQPYTPDLALSMRAGLAEAYGWHGHADVRVRVASETRGESGSVELHLEVAPGPRVTIGEVKVVGNEKTRTSRVMAELTLEAGDVWDTREERESFRRLYRTGLFTTVRLKLEPREGETRTLVVEVEEAPTSEFYIEPGYGSYEGLRALAGWHERNLFGTGRSLEIEALLAERAQRGLVRFGEPHLFDTEFAGNLSFFNEHRIEPAFDSTEFGAGLGVARELSERSRISAEYRLRASQISDAVTTDPAAQQALQDVDISSVQLSPTFDTRSNPLAPRDGSLSRAVLEYASDAIGSELEFLRFGVTHARFHLLRPSTVLALSARVGVIAPLASTSTIPLQERYFNGGENTVRSFSEDQLGPKDTQGNPLGGEAYNVLSAELRQVLRGNLEAALFFDTGNLIDDYTDYFDFDDFRHAIGLGVRYRLPIGPIRFDYGWNPDPRADEDSWAAHLSVGMAF